MTDKQSVLPPEYRQLLSVCSRVEIKDSLTGTTLTVKHSDPRDDFEVGGDDIGEVARKAIQFVKKRRERITDQKGL